MSEIFRILTASEAHDIAVDELIERWPALPADVLLKDIFTTFGPRAALGTSFQKIGLVAKDRESESRKDTIPLDNHSTLS